MTASRLDALKRCPVLAGLADSALAKFASTCAWREYQAGAQLLGYQDISTDVFFIVAGKARVVIYSAEGKAVLFHLLEAGSLFGELAAIDGGPRSASIEAVEPSTVASLTASQFKALLQQEPAAAMAVMQNMAAVLRRLSERIHEFSTLVVQNRIQAELLRLAERCKAGPGKGALIVPAPSLNDIAHRVSTHREAVSRELSRLSAIGLLHRESGGLRISDIEYLAGLVREAKGE